MARRLTQQQNRRIAARREALIAAEGTAETGLVVASYGKRVIVERSDGVRHKCQLRANLDGLVTGDRVHWQPDGDEGVVMAMEPRANSLRRPDARGRLRTMAANIDLMIVVIAPIPEPHANLIDRYLVAAHHEGIEAALVLNKQDLLAGDSVLPKLMGEYERLGYATAITGAHDVEASALAPLMHDRTVVLVGQSGVGKSSLVQRLLPEQEIRVGELSEGMGKGRHTTTASELFHLNNGGSLIDSPGIRDFHLSHLPEAEVAWGFREFHGLLGACRYRDCRHMGEAGCAIEAAALAGTISPRRLESYRLIVAGLNESG